MRKSLAVAVGAVALVSVSSVIAQNAPQQGWGVPSVISKAISFLGQVTVEDNTGILFGTSPGVANQMLIADAETSLNTPGVIGVATTGRQLWLMDNGDTGFDRNLAAQANPTLLIASNNQSTTQAGKLYHDTTAFFVSSLNDAVSIGDDDDQVQVGGATGTINVGSGIGALIFVGGGFAGSGDTTAIGSANFSLDDNGLLLDGGAAGNSPSVQIFPGSGTGFLIYAVDSDDDLQIEANNTAATEKVEINNTGAGTLDFDLVDGALLTGGTTRLTNAGAATLASVNLGGATVLDILTATATVDFGATTGGTCDDSSGITMTGAAAGNSCSVGLPAAPDADTSVWAFVSGSNEVKVRRCCVKLAGNCADGTSGTFRVTCMQF